MLVKNVKGESVGASMVRDSEFYIELAKFVQAYTLIINNPNEFLAEVGESSINEKTGRVTWPQLIKIINKCDFGFVSIPTDTELKVFYNYALEIGSLDSVKKKVASVSDVADAQKHYYNFVDDAKGRAEEAYQKQKRHPAHRASFHNALPPDLRRRFSPPHFRCYVRNTAHGYLPFFSAHRSSSQAKRPFSLALHLPAHGCNLC